MVAIPPHMLAELKLGPGSSVGISVDGNRLVIEPVSKAKRIGLEARLAMCDFTIPMSGEEREWLDVKSVGREVI
jgi:antitoxin ChpS